MPVAVHKGTRPSIPDNTPPEMMEVWDIAQECWSGNPWDRPSFQTVVVKLDDLAFKEDIIPSALREPGPMQVASLAGYLRSIADGSLPSRRAVSQILTNVLNAEDYDKCVRDLCSHKVDPQSFIDGLDKVCSGPSLFLTTLHSHPLGYQAIDILWSRSDIHERCVRALSKACGIYGLLPDSHEIKSTLTMSEHANASGGFSDIWKATNENGEVFAVKALRMYQNNALQVKKVR